MIAKVHKLVKFNTLKQFNNAMEQWMIDYKDKFTKAEHQAFNRLKRYACKYQGVAFARICKMLQTNYEIQGSNAISRSSFERMISKAKRFGMLEVIRRKNGAFFVFVPYRNTIEVSKSEQLKSTLLSSQSFETSNKKDIIYSDNLDIEELEMMKAYQERQKKIREANNKKKIPKFNWLRS